MKILVTGANGFVGSHFLRLVNGVSFNSTSCPPIDLVDLEGVKKKVEEVRPDAVVHLAAQSDVPESFRSPRRTFEVNFYGTFNLLSALLDIQFKGRLLFVGSADAYGQVDETDLPIPEDLPLRPRNPYAVSKVAAEALCYQFSQTSPYEVIMARPFNHIGPGQGEGPAISNFAKQIIEIKKQRRLPVLSVGNLEVSRDFTDVRDVVKGYRLLLEKGKNGEVYNVGSGREFKISELLRKLTEMESLDIKLETDASRLRPFEQKRVVASIKKLQRDTGWKPDIPIEKTLKDILDYWREVIP
jgi:Nucleoside-diphosphate-sugar epimerases